MKKYKINVRAGFIQLYGQYSMYSIQFKTRFILTYCIKIKIFEIKEVFYIMCLSYMNT